MRVVRGFRDGIQVDGEMGKVSVVQSSVKNLFCEFPSSLQVRVWRQNWPEDFK